MINHLSENNPKWFAVYTKYKCEKRVVDALVSKQIEAYVPLVSTTKKYVRKIKTYHKPLFNSYVFVNITKSEYVKVLQTEHVYKFLKVSSDLESIPEYEINLLKRIVGEFDEITTGNEIVKGDEVEVISGNLTGLKGKLISKETKNNFLIELDSIGFSLRVHINPVYLRSIHTVAAH